MAKRLDGSGIRIPLGTEIGFSPGNIVLSGDQAPSRMERGTAAPHFSAHVYCDRMAEWIKMPFNTEVGLVPGDIVLNGDPAPPPQRGTAPNFPPISVVAKLLDRSRCHLVWR